MIKLVCCAGLMDTDQRPVSGRQGNRHSAWVCLVGFFSLFTHWRKSDAFVYSQLAIASSCSQLSYIREEQCFNWRWFHMATPNEFLSSAPNLPRNWWEAPFFFLPLSCREVLKFALPVNTHTYLLMIFINIQS